MNINHDEQANQFTATLDGDDETAHLSYSRQRDALNLYHVFVPGSHRGQGVASKLTQAAVDHARAEGLKIVPTCPYVVSWVQRHPEVEDMVK